MCRPTRIIIDEYELVHFWFIFHIAMPILVSDYFVDAVFYIVIETDRLFWLCIYVSNLSPIDVFVLEYQNGRQQGLSRQIIPAAITVGHHGRRDLNQSKGIHCVYRCLARPGLTSCIHSMLVPMDTLLRFLLHVWRCLRLAPRRRRPDPINLGATHSSHLRRSF